MPDAPDLPASPLSREADADFAPAFLRWRRALLALSLLLISVGLWGELDFTRAMARARAHAASLGDPVPKAQDLLAGATLFGGPTLLLGLIGLTIGIGSGQRPSRWAVIPFVLSRLMAAVGVVGYWAFIESGGLTPFQQAAPVAGLVGWPLVLLLPLGAEGRPKRPLRAASALCAVAPAIALATEMARTWAVNPLPGQAITPYSVLSAVGVLLAPLAGTGLLLWLIVREPRAPSE